MAHADAMMQQLRGICQKGFNGSQDCLKAGSINIDLNQWFYWYATDFITNLAVEESSHGLQDLKTASYLRFLNIAPTLILKAAVLSHLGFGTMVNLLAYIFAGKFSQLAADLTQTLKRDCGHNHEKTGDLAELLLEAKKARVCH